MHLEDFLNKNFIIAWLQATEKKAVIKELVNVLPDIDAQAAFAVLLEREKLGSTGIGHGIAIPHGKMKDLTEIRVVVGRSPEGVEFDALDSEPCHIFFLVLAPEDATGKHLRVLAQISRKLKDETFCKKFMQAETVDNIWELLTRWE